MDKNRIDEEARKFALEDDDGFAVRNSDKEDGFKAGAAWMLAELTRWHDPKEELPEENSTVLCKVAGYTESDYLTLRYSNNSWWIYHTESSPFGPVGCKVFFPHEVLGWRELNE